MPFRVARGSPIGLVPDTGGTYVLPRLAGLARATDASAASTFEGQLSSEQRLQQALGADSPDFIEGVRAVVAKREPRFEGRCHIVNPARGSTVVALSESKSSAPECGQSGSLASVQSWPSFS